MVAFAIPSTRHAVLHSGGATVQRVGVLPPAQQSRLGRPLGRVVSSEGAARVLGGSFRVPPTNGTPLLYLQENVVSALLAAPRPLLLSEFQSGGPAILTKLLGAATGLESLQIGKGAPGIWIFDASHVFIGPDAPRRVTGPTLVWVAGTVAYRLEGRGLTMEMALKLAGEIDRA